MEFPMNVLDFGAALMSVGLLMAAPAFAQTTPAQKQRTQEGAGYLFECSKPYNANPANDPDCKRLTQNLAPSSTQASYGATAKHN
jgi:hypothetical protein